MKRFAPGIIILVFLAFIAVFTTPSCNKNRECKVVVRVIDDSLNQPISGALCTLYCSPNTCIIEEVERTGADGEADFTFANPAILLVEINLGDTATFDGKYVELEAGETVEKIVEIPLY